MKDGFKSSVTSSLDDILKGEILTRLSRNVSPEDVDAMTVQARRRFAKNALWTIGAIDVEYVDIKSRPRLKAAFDELRLAGGTLIVVITDKPRIATAFQMAAIHAGNIPLKIAKNSKESSEISAAHRATYKKP